MSEALPGDLLAARREIADLGSRRDSTMEQAAAALADIQSLRGKLTAAASLGDVQLTAALQAQVDDAVNRRKGLLENAAVAGRSLVDITARLAIDDLRAESDVPVALLPVRIETRSMPGRAQLRVRIYPDDLHVDSHDPGLSDEERAAGEEYWNAVWAADNADALTALATKVGARRAAWVVQAMTPTNIATRPADVPVPPATQPRGNRPAVVRTLPDRFHVFAVQGGVISEAVGNAIPDQLPAGLPNSDDFTPIPKGDLPLLDESMRWMVDYDAAVASGMAVTLNLQQPGVKIDRLVVLGIRSTLDPDAAAGRIDDLLAAHRFTDGAAFVAQGTPTNNTDSDRSAWSLLTAVAPPAAATPPAAAGSNAAVLASALGAQPATPAAWPLGDGIEQPRARAMNTALWAPTWEAMLDRILGDDARGLTVTDAERDDIRSHFIERVRARGPVPALRLGKQPYGVLPIVPIDANSFHGTGGTIENRLVPFLEQVRLIWELGVQSVPRVMQGNIDQVMPDILGISPVLEALRVRSVTASNKCYGPFIGLIADDANTQAQQEVASLAWQLVAVEPTKVSDNGLLGKGTRPLALPLTDDNDPAFIRGLLATPPAAPTPTSILQVLLGLAAGLELTRRDSAATPSEVDRLRGAAFEQAGQDVDPNVLGGAFAEVLQNAPNPEFTAKAADMIGRTVGRFDSTQLAARQPLVGLSTSSAFGSLTNNGQVMESLNAGRAALQVAGAVFAAYRRQAEFRAALQIIADVPTAEDRALLLSETLDLCSHRFDAWVTSIATNRLSGLRQAKSGTVLGAYGWLEDIELADPVPVQAPPGMQGPLMENPADGGYIHAPSLTHATTAAVLRSGRLTHHRGDANEAALNIDISSGRVREAVSIIDGIRKGQPLGALLGYRLERRLHDRSGGGLELDRFIYVLRGLAPLVAGKLTDRNNTDQTVAASDVVDGVALREIPFPTIDAALVKGPIDNPFIVAWVPPTPAETAAVHDAITELDLTYDALADVLLAESVHQLVQGNTARAAAAMDAIGGGESVPPLPEVVRTPRSGTSLTHRLAVLIGEPAVARAGWNRAAPRALAEPRLEAWAEAQFGDANAIPLSAAHTLDETGICALDLLYEADGDQVTATSFGWRLARTIPGLGDDLTAFKPAWELARSLRRLTTNARPALPTRRETDGVVTWSVPALLGRELPVTFEPAAFPTFKARADQAQAALEAAAAQAFDPGDDASVRTAIDALVPFGLRVPPRANVLPLAQLAALAASLAAEAARRAARAKEILASAGDDHPESVVTALTAIFGDGFLGLPLIAAPAAQDALSAALGAAGVRAADGLEIRPWLARAAAVRVGAARYAETLLYREALSGRIGLRVAQAPLGAFPKWIGLPFADDFAAPQVPTAALVFESAAAAPLTGGEPLAAFVFEEWTDVVPRRVVVGSPDAPPDRRTVRTIATTGVAVNANGPNARPPQSILLAVSPDGALWSKDSLLHAVLDTLDLAKTRAVTLERVPWAGRILPALYFKDWALQGEPVIDFIKLSEQFNAAFVLKYVKE